MSVILHKANHFHVQGASQKEESPVTSIQQLTKRIEDLADSRLYSVLKEVFTKWLSSSLSKASTLPFKINGKIRINPKTGKPLTAAEWKAIDSDVTKLLKWAFSDSEDMISKKAIALGKILAVMPLESELDSLPVTASLANDPYLANAVAFAEQNAAEYVTSVSDTLRKDIKTSIVEALKNKWSTKQLEDVLFDKFATRNRDFRMIAETELNTNAVNGYLLTQLEASKGKTVFVKGVSNVNACPFCKANINNKTFVLLSEAPNDGLDNTNIDGKDYEAVWPGKNNIGRARADWWSAVPAHPHCYDDITEVMTNNGWKLFKDLLDTDLIMSMNPKDREIGFVPFTHRVSYRYKGKMIHFSGRTYDLLVTPDHNMCFSTSHDLHDAPLREASAADLIRDYSKSGFQLPRAQGVWKGKLDKSITTLCKLKKIEVEDFIRLCAWFLSEGSIQVVNQNTQRKQINLAQKDPSVIYNDMKSLQPYLRIGQVCCWIFDKDICAFFKNYVKTKSWEKYIPNSIKLVPAALSRLFLDTYIKGDGSDYAYRGDKSFSSTSKARRVIFTSSDRMLDDLSEMVIKAGWMPSYHGKQLNKGKVCHFPNGDYECKHDVHILNICTSKTKDYTPHASGKRVMPYEMNYEGMVYDVTLEKWHHLLVRRNRKVAWSGNCACWYVAINPAFSKYRQQLTDKIQKMKDQGIRIPTLQKSTSGNHYYTDKLGRTWFWNKMLKKYQYIKRPRFAAKQTDMGKEIHVDDLLTDSRFKKMIGSIMAFNGAKRTLPDTINAIKADKVTAAKIISLYKKILSDKQKVAANACFDAFETDLLDLYDKVNTTPVRVLFHSSEPSVIDGMVEKGRYENLFTLRQDDNVSVGSGSLNLAARDSWEEHIAGISLKNVPNIFRPSYGVLPFNESKDVSSQYYMYGSASLVLKDSTRSRTTYTLGNSSTQLGAFVASNPAEVFTRQKHLPWLTSMLQTVTDPQHPTHSHEMLYIEAQVWGGIDLSRDVKEIRVGLVSLYGETPLNALLSLQHLMHLSLKYKLPLFIEFKGKVVSDVSSVYSSQIAPLLPKNAAKASDYAEVEHKFKVFIKNLYLSQDKEDSNSEDSSV